MSPCCCPRSPSGRFSRTADRGAGDGRRDDRRRAADGADRLPAAPRRTRCRRAAVLVRRRADSPELQIAVPVMVAGTIVVGLLMERIAYRPLRGAPDVAVLLSSFAVGQILQNS